MPWLLDTNTLSELRRPKPNPRVVEFVSGCPLDQLYVSTVVFAEIRFGIATVNDTHLRDELNAWLTGQLRPMFASRVLELTENVMLRWRLLVEAGRKTGRTFSQPDSGRLFVGLQELDRYLQQQADQDARKPWLCPTSLFQTMTALPASIPSRPITSGWMTFRLNS